MVRDIQSPDVARRNVVIQFDVENLKVSTRAKAERISRFAFDFALKNGRKVSPSSVSTRPGRTDPFTESDMCPQGQHHEAR